MKHIFLLIPVGFLALLAQSRADVNPAIISADAKWAVSVDLNALRESALGKEILATVQKHAQADTPAGDVRIDVAKLSATIGRLTAYGTNFAAKPERLDQVDGVLVAEGTADLRKMVESMLLQLTLAQPKEFAEVEGLPFPAYAAHNEVFIAFPPEPIVLVSKSKAQVLKAHDVYRGAVPTLAKTPGSPLSQLITPATHSYLAAASLVPAESAFSVQGPQTRILQLVESGAVTIGERDSNTTAHVQLLAASDANATKLQKILDGMTAMLSLAETNDQRLSEFMKSAHTGRDGRTITLDLAYSSERLSQMIKSLQDVSTPAMRGERPVVQGNAIAEWNVDSADAPADANHAALKTVENVALTNGSMVFFGRSPNARSGRVDRVEIAPADGGAPMIFRGQMLRSMGPFMQQIQFPGEDGRYTLKVHFIADAEGKAKFAVSVRDPNARAEKSGSSPSPVVPQPKSTK